MKGTPGHYRLVVPELNYLNEEEVAELVAALQRIIDHSLDEIFQNEK